VCETPAMLKSPEEIWR